MMKRQIVIIGAGVAGLTAGYEILSKYRDAFDVLIIDRDAHVGGLAKTVSCGEYSIDLGGHRFFSKNDEIIKWWKNILPEGDLLDVSRHSHILYDGKRISYPLTLQWDTIRKVGLRQGFRITWSFFQAKIKPHEIRSLEDFYINRFGEYLYKLFFEDYTKKVWGRSAAEIPPDWGYQRVRGLSFIKAIADSLHLKDDANREISLTDHFYYPRLGSGYLWEQVAERFRALGGNLLTEKSIEEICLNDGRIAWIALNDGTKVNTDYLLSSMPLQDLIATLPDVPSQVKAAADYLQYRDFVIVGMTVSKECIIDSLLVDASGALIPDQWIYIQDNRVRMGRIQLLNNWSQFLAPSSGDIVLGVEYFCQEHDDDWNMTDRNWTRLALSELKTLKLLRADAIEKSAAVYRVEKAYPCYWDGYLQIDCIVEYLNCIDNLLCIGRNGQHHYNNMDHAMITAFRAVEYLTGIISKKEVWNVNQNHSYHEDTLRSSKNNQSA